MAAAFVARSFFPTLNSLPRSYFLGHHRAGLKEIKTLMSGIDLFLECRDYRVPLASHNPLFEEHLADKKRIIVYTKHDLGNSDDGLDRTRRTVLKDWHDPLRVFFSNGNDMAIQRILKLIRESTQTNEKLTGPRMMVIGMPNVGKSTLLNSLRRVGVGKGKAARTGAQPGVTRGIASSVKILDGKDESEMVYLLDTPGVFVPYVPDGESMLKLALCGAVKDTIISPVIVADYLLYRMNLVAPQLYKNYSPPTNDATELLQTIARKTGRLQKTGTPDDHAAALWLIQRWRKGEFGKFVLDDVSNESLLEDKHRRDNMAPSLNQARKAAKESRRVKQQTSTM